MYIPSTYNPALDMSGLFPVVDITTGPDLLARPGKRTISMDFLNQSFQELLNNIRFWDNDVYNGQKWTTMCYLHQGTTSLWLFNLAFNGLDSPRQLQPGMVVRFPAMSEISRVIAQINAKQSVGQVVSIGPKNVVGGP